MLPDSGFRDCFFLFEHFGGCRYRDFTFQGPDLTKQEIKIVLNIPPFELSEKSKGLDESFLVLTLEKIVS